MSRIKDFVFSGWVLGEERTIMQTAFWFFVTVGVISVSWADGDYNFLAMIALVQAGIIHLDNVIKINKDKS